MNLPSWLEGRLDWLYHIHLETLSCTWVPTVPISSIHSHSMEGPSSLCRYTSSRFLGMMTSQSNLSWYHPTLLLLTLGYLDSEQGLTVSQIRSINCLCLGQTPCDSPLMPCNPTAPQLLPPSLDQCGWGKPLMMVPALKWLWIDLDKDYNVPNLCYLLYEW